MRRALAQARRPPQRVVSEPQVGGLAPRWTLLWDRDGYVLWYKRLESGVFKLRRTQGRAQELRASELAMILDGIDVGSLKRVPRYAQKYHTA